MSKKTLTVIIEAEFGSEAQAKPAVDNLSFLLKSWGGVYSTRHKKNKIVINADLDGEEVF